MSYLFLHYTLAPLTLAFWRDLFTATGLFLILLCVKPVLLRVKRRDLPFLLLYGLFGLACFNAIWAYSVAYNGASVSTVLLYTGPAFVALASRCLVRRAALLEQDPGHRPGHRRLRVGSAGVRPGLRAVQSRRDSDWPGVGVGFAVYSLFGKAASNRLNPWTTTAYTFAFGSFFLLLTRPFDQLWSLGTAVDGWLLLLLSWPCPR